MTDNWIDERTFKFFIFRIARNAQLRYFSRRETIGGWIKAEKFAKMFQSSDYHCWLVTANKLTWTMIDEHLPTHRKSTVRFEEAVKSHFPRSRLATLRVEDWRPVNDIFVWDFPCGIERVSANREWSKEMKVNFRRTGKFESQICAVSWKLNSNEPTSKQHRRKDQRL